MVVHGGKVNSYKLKDKIKAISRYIFQVKYISWLIVKLKAVKSRDNSLSINLHFFIIQNLISSL